METKPKKVSEKYGEFKTRLLIQLRSDNPFGGDLHEVGIYKNYNEAMNEAIKLFYKDEIRTILVNDGPQWVKIK